MKKILLASVALSAFAGAAAAEVSLTWGGTATVGMAREGGADAGTASDSYTALGATKQGVLNTDVLARVNALRGATGLAAATDAATSRKILAAVAADSSAVAAALNMTVKAVNDEVALLTAIVNGTNGSAASDTGDFDSYSEVNLTATATVTTDYGISVTGAVSVDAGTGYDFADDDGFDAAKTNGVALDYITIDGGSFGALTFDKNDIAHLVDDDDDETGDLQYTNDFGVASFALVMDIAKDTDVVARRAEFVGYNGTATATDTEAEALAVLEADYASGGTTANEVAYYKAVAADVAWSAMISAPIADMGTVYAAFDEEGGNAFGGSFMVANVTIGLDSKLEALEEELGEDRSNTISLAYAVDGLSLGAEWNSVEDGNQWAVNAAYAANGMSVAFDTNEGDEWTATASYDLSDAASVDLGVNYTEDAFVGLSLAF